MICFLVIFCAFAFGLIHESRSHSSYYKTDLTDYILVIGLSFLIAMLCTILVCYITTLYADTEAYECEQIELVALKDDASNNFLSVEYIDDGTQYTFAMQESGKGIIMKTISAKEYDCYINYTNGQPYAVKSQYTYTNPAFQKVFFCFKHDEYTFYVPEE
jgi:hypothetical protein